MFAGKAFPPEQFIFLQMEDGDKVEIRDGEMERKIIIMLLRPVQANAFVKAHHGPSSLSLSSHHISSSQRESLRYGPASSPEIHPQGPNLRQRKRVWR